MQVVRRIIDTFSFENFPYKRVFLFLFIWILSIMANYGVKRFLNLHIDTPTYFPFSIFNPSFHASGLLYAMLFIFIIYLTLRYRVYKNIITTYLVGVSLIVLGNLSLGNIDLAFINPIAGGDIQYYHNAIKIDSWQHWLSTFNNTQESLFCHARTHPPGALLIEKLFFTISKNPIWISSIFLLLSSFSIVLVYKIFIELGKDKIFANKIGLLYSVIPSVNIYSLATLDAVISMLINLVLLGVIIILESKKKERIVVWSILSAASLTLTSFLTFGSIYLWAVLGVFSLFLVYFHKNTKILILLILSIIVFLLVVFYLNQAYNYNYFVSFFTASKLENPHGFMLFSDPFNYLATRIEDVFEIAIFLSFGLIAVLSTIRYKLQHNLYIVLAFIAIGMLLLMFLAGAYRTGETARACLFIVGFILILIKDIPRSLLTPLITFAALQTILMQVLGFYFW